MHAQGEFVADLIEASQRKLARGALERQFAAPAEPATMRPGSPVGDWLRDTEVRLSCVANALAAGAPELFAQHVAWMRKAFAGADVDPELLRANLVALRAELSDALPAEHFELVRACIARAELELAGPPRECPQPEQDDRWTQLAHRFLLAVLEARPEEGTALLLDAQRAGASIADLHARVISRALTDIGGMWLRGEIHVADEHLASNVVREAMVLLRAAAPRAPRNGKRILLASVPGNLHDLGVRMVGDQLELAGFYVSFLGANTPARDLLAAAADSRPDLIALAVQLGVQVRTCAALIGLLRRELGREVPPILVGGGPFASVPGLWRAVGADGSAPDAAAAVLEVSRLLPAG